MSVEVGKLSSADQRKPRLSVPRYTQHTFPVSRLARKSTSEKGRNLHNAKLELGEKHALSCKRMHVFVNASTRHYAGNKIDC